MTVGQHPAVSAYCIDPRRTSGKGVASASGGTGPDGHHLDWPLLVPRIGVGGMKRTGGQGKHPIRPRARGQPLPPHGRYLTRVDTFRIEDQEQGVTAIGQTYVDPSARWSEISERLWPTLTSLPSES